MYFLACEKLTHVLIAFFFYMCFLIALIKCVLK